MNNQAKTIVLSILGGLVLGLLLGFIPEHLSNSSQKEQIGTLGQDKVGLQKHLDQTANKLSLSNFAVRAGVMSAQAEANNYSLSSSTASGLFTGLRQYVDNGPSGSAKQQMEEVLAARDRTIAGLAQANPAVKPLLQQIFLRLEETSASVNQQ